MAAYKTEQRYLVHQGAEYHFVSYEGQAANPKKALLATPPTWCLMKAGKRWPVMEQVPGVAPEEIDRQLIGWLEEQRFPAVPRDPRAHRDLANTANSPASVPGSNASLVPARGR